MDRRYTIKKMRYEQVRQSRAMDLVWRVFHEFEAPEYADEGISAFQAYISPDAVERRMTEGELSVWGCFYEEGIVGLIAVRPPLHISLLFVDKAHHRQGIASALYETVLHHYTNESGDTEVTVHSSPYALEVYHKMGFVDTDAEQTVDGLRFTPMKHTFR